MMTAFTRTIILYFLIMVGLRLMGKRQIGELEPSELVLTMMISDLATVPMQDFGIPLLAGVIPILTLLSISMLLSQISLRHLRFRAMICGTPSVLIRNGELQQDAMRRNRLTVDELLEALRGQGISDLREVKYAVLETSGQLSVLPRADCQPVTPRQLSLQPEDPQTLPIVVISDGRLLRRSMEQGNSFADALAEGSLFDPLHGRMIRMGAAVGREDQVMETVARTYEEEVEEGIGRLISIIEPTLVAFLCVVIGMILLSVMLPMAGIISSMI